MTQRQFGILLQWVGNRLEPKSYANNAWTPEQKLLTTLRFFATNELFSSIYDTQGHLS